MLRGGGLGTPATFPTRSRTVAHTPPVVVLILPPSTLVSADRCSSDPVLRTMWTAYDGLSPLPLFLNVTHVRFTIPRVTIGSVHELQRGGELTMDRG